MLHQMTVILAERGMTAALLLAQARGQGKAAGVCVNFQFIVVIINISWTGTGDLLI